jgi:AcrR family transcriptional regulator
MSSCPDKPETALRSDALRNRRALLQAARALFASNIDVPMYEIARLAGVGQATLYRHFPDRGALAGALLEEILDELEVFASGHPEGTDLFFPLLQRFIELASQSGGLIAAVREGAGAESELKYLNDRLFALFACPLGEAKASGLVRPDFELEDVLCTVKMVHGALDAVEIDFDLRSAGASRALDLIINGIAGRNPNGRKPTGSRAVT